MKELEAIRQQLAHLDRLDDPTVGLTALHGDVTQSRLKILEKIEGGSTGLREENREVRRRQDRMINDLNETRSELRQLLDLADLLRPLVPPEGTGDPTGEGTQTPPERTTQPPEPEAGYGSSAGAEGHPRVSTHTDSQGGTMENTGHRPQLATGEDQDLALKSAIEAAYQGTGTSSGQPWAATPQASAGAEDPRIAHGVLLLKAAGVASAELIAHRDTWEWLAALAVDHSHFRTPPSVEDNQGRPRPDRPVRTLPHRSAHRAVEHPLHRHPAGGRLGHGRDLLQPYRSQTHRPHRTRRDHPHHPGRRFLPRRRRLTGIPPTSRRRPPGTIRAAVLIRELRGRRHGGTRVVTFGESSDADFRLLSAVPAAVEPPQSFSKWCASATVKEVGQRGRGGTGAGRTYVW
ncbi:hypothetical protein ACFW6E_45215 [Streptomyces olivaceoviridis]|uniref:hypothetical protein n=1 Tax=Streptomyces olivaceoviridis TaxID=1921 RepID=UPI003685D3F3